MTAANCEIGRNDALTRFLISDPIIKRFGQFEDHETMEDKLKYKFQNGFVDVGDLPCRKHFWQQMANRSVDLNDKPECPHINFANGKRKVDFSGFIYTPTHVQYWAETILHSDKKQSCNFKLSTCGGVRIWVNRKLVTQFTPFKRNTVSSVEISLPLEQGKNEVIVHAEDLFERDTQYFFELILLDDTHLKTYLDGLNEQNLADIEAFTSGLAYNLNVKNHQFYLQSECELPASLSVKGRIWGMSNEEEIDETLTLQSIQIEQNKFCLQLPPTLKPAHYAVELAFQYQGIELKRVCNVNIMPEGKAPAQSSIQARKQNGLAFIAAEGMNTTGKLLALLANKSNPELAASILNRTLQKISLREDCSDFWMVSVLWAWKMSNYTQLPDKMWDRVKSSILGYRYWLDEPGNDAMWFWSENHVLCFHVSQLLAGQYFPREQFLCSGRLGNEQQKIASQRLNLWFDHILENGLTEWNSSCYYPIDYIGLFAIYELSDCDLLKQKAKTVIDRLMIMSALHFQNGVASGTMGRVYEKELMANEMTELAGFGHIAWGDGWHTRMCASLPMFCLSQYEPPALSNEIARLENRNSVEAYYTQGMDKAAKILVWKQAGVMLSSSVDHLTGKPGHQQHLLDIQFAKNPKARVWLNHPGEDTPGGEGRPSYWAGNGVLPRVMQHKNTAMMLFKLNADTRVKFTHIYLPTEALDEVFINEHWCMIKSGNAFVVIGCSEPIERVSQGLTRGREVRSYGEQSAWYVEVGNLSPELNFEQLVASWKDTKVELRGSESSAVAKISTPTEQSFQLSWDGACIVNNQSWSFPPEAGLNPIIK
ncbi:hypothetical protein [Catenovulum adriaticum]|uniref:Uncharacterized protein n=1 Tax=Catenovulum adriaticum TaxID=2984846 RepID=A0ABY7ASC9_9ALTE|nr:hypothetical protein [Catenovulum sp. TS8]WAJ72173.1 hypothetical protein OLW01_18005 [Catenovulum sp. TS8]